MKLSSISISTKVFLIPIIGTIGFAIYLLLTTQTANENVALLDDAKKRLFPLVQLAIKTNNGIRAIEVALNSSVTTGDEDAITEASTLADAMRANLAEMNKLAPSLSEDIRNIEKLFTVYTEKGIALSEGMINETIDFSQLPQLGQDLSHALDALKNAVDQFQNARRTEFEDSIRLASDQGESLVYKGFIMGVITILLLFLTAVPISKGIRSSLLDVVESLKDMAHGEGDLTVRLTSKNQDEIGELVTWFNTFIEKLQSTVSDIIAVVEPLTEMADKVKLTANQTEGTTRAQQEGTVQTQHAVSEMNESMQSVAENASQTAVAVNQASALAEDGRKVVDLTIGAIDSVAKNVVETNEVVDRLEKDVNQVSAVLDVIKSIAEQTNLLALNAAIEAARAGEQGRGFAVVADEVRTLASRTQSSTAEIQSTIEKLQQATKQAVNAMNVGRDMTERSVSEARQAGNSLQSIESTIHEISSMAESIAAATEQQSMVAKDIVTNIDDIGKSTEQTRSTSMELAGVSNDLAKLSAQLKSLTNAFKV